jgi:hypothetical protein
LNISLVMLLLQSSSQEKAHSLKRALPMAPLLLCSHLKRTKRTMNSLSGTT